MPDKALLVVDMLNDFMPGGTLTVSGIEDIVVPIKAKIAEYEEAGNPVFFICDNHKVDDKEFDSFPAHCIDGTVGAEITDDIAIMVGSHEIIPKTRFSSFFRTNLEHRLLAGGANPQESTVEVCGVATSICIEATVEGLYYRDYDTTVDSGCVTDLTDEAHAEALNRMSSLYGTTIT
jgi:nicotinamidase-related amidase